jgi:hypothetical protein
MLKYWQEKKLDVELLEQFFIENLSKFDIVDSLCRIFKENSNSDLPLILSFSTVFYLAIIKNNYVSTEQGFYDFIIIFNL